jgi:endonuclease-3
VAERIGLTIKAKNPLDSERQLVQYLPDEVIPKAHHWLILHGRYVCKARRPLCENCGITHFCHWFLTNKHQ